MTRYAWFGVVLILAALGGGYSIVTNRMSGARWDRMLPETRTQALELVRRANAAGLDVMFWDGWRSPQATARNVAAGTSKVADSYGSLHTWGVAFDIVFRNAAGLPYWPDDTDPRWRQLAEIGRGLGLNSGGLMWGWDWPHFQLPGYRASALKSSYGVNYLAFLQSRGAVVA